MKIEINILYKSGTDRTYLMKQTDSDEILTKEDLKEAINYFQDELIHKCYKDDVKGYFDFTTQDGDFVTVNLPETSEVKFKIIK
jgi:hypothetical protein